MGGEGVWTFGVSLKLTQKKAPLCGRGVEMRRCGCVAFFSSPQGG